MEKSNSSHVILSAALSIDGKIATSTGDSKFSSKDDLVRLHKLRSAVDAIVVGKNTALKDDPLLTVRYVKGRNPVRVLLDPKGSIPNNSKILQTSSNVRTIIAVSKQISKSNKKRLEKFPVEIIIAGKNSIDLKALIKKLARKKIQTILVEGGGITNWNFVKQNLFDELIITLSPFLIGGKSSVSFVEGDGFKKIVDSPNLHLKSVKRLKNHLVLNYVRMHADGKLSEYES